MMDVAHGEMVEKELTRMIEKRSRKEPDPDEQEEVWKESVRAYNAARSKERRAEWYSYHLDQAERLRRTMEPLVAFHEARAAALCQESGRG
ncbi:MAG: hypothetical protein WKF67_07660 [Rubrobacteraceae bacterium]